MILDEDTGCADGPSGQPEADDPPDTAPDGTCIECGRLLVDPRGLWCAACQPQTLPLEPEDA